MSLSLLLKASEKHLCLGRTFPCPYAVVGSPKMPGIMVGMDQVDSCVDEEAHVLAMKYPIEHADSGMYKAEALDAVLPSIVGGYNMPGITVGMDQKDRNYDTSWLSEDLMTDPIIDTIWDEGV